MKCFFCATPVSLHGGGSVSRQYTIMVHTTAFSKEKQLCLGCLRAYNKLLRENTPTDYQRGVARTLLCRLKRKQEGCDCSANFGMEKERVFGCDFVRGVGLLEEE